MKRQDLLYIALRFSAAEIRAALKDQPKFIHDIKQELHMTVSFKPSQTDLRALLPLLGSSFPVQAAAIGVYEKNGQTRNIGILLDPSSLPKPVADHADLTNPHITIWIANGARAYDTRYALPVAPLRCQLTGTLAVYDRNNSSDTAIR